MKIFYFISIIPLILGIMFVIYDYNHNVKAASKSDQIYTSHINNNTIEYHNCVYNTSCDIQRFNAMHNISELNYKGPEGLAIIGLQIKEAIIIIFSMVCSIFIFRIR